MVKPKLGEIIKNKRFFKISIKPNLRKNVAESGGC